MEEKNIEEKNEQAVVEIVEKEEDKVEEKKEEIKETKNKSGKKLLIVLIIIILVVVALLIGWFLGKSSNDEEKVNNNETKEDDQSVPEKEEGVALDIDVAPNPTVVKPREEFKVRTTTAKPEYYGEEDYYKDGYLGYYTESYYGNLGDNVYPDREMGDFIQLYECKNKEYGKCGFIEPMGVDGSYTLEEGLKIAQEGYIYADNRYVFVYDGNIYYETETPSYLGEESPLIIYDTIEKKELGRYSAVYNTTYNAKRNYFVVVDFDNKYSVIKLENGKLDVVVESNYDYIGHLYESSQFMLVKDNQYYVHNPSTNKTYGPYNNQIASYSEKYIITNEGSYLDNTENNYRLYSIDGKKILTDAGYKYMEAAGDLVIVVDKNESLNVYDSDGKAIFEKPVEKITGAYHIRCCAARMAYEYKITGNTMELIVNTYMNSKDESYEYVINLKDKTYTSKKYVYED